MPTCFQRCQLADEIIGAAPKDADICAVGEIVFQVAAGAVRLQDAALFRLDLGGDVGIAGAPSPPCWERMLRNSTRKFQSSIWKPRKSRRRVGQGAAAPRAGSGLCCW